MARPAGLFTALFGWNDIMLDPAVSTQSPNVGETPQNSVFIIKDIRPICRARTLRLQTDDAIIAVDGEPFKGDVELLLDMIFECDPDTGIFLTIFREGGLFHVIARGPRALVVCDLHQRMLRCSRSRLTNRSSAPIFALSGLKWWWHS